MDGEWSQIGCQLNNGRPPKRTRLVSACTMKRSTQKLRGNPDFDNGWMSSECGLVDKPACRRVDGQADVNECARRKEKRITVGQRTTVNSHPHSPLHQPLSCCLSCWRLCCRFPMSGCDTCSHHARLADECA